MITLTNTIQDTLQELVNIGVGQAAGTLNEMLQTHIRLQIPYLYILPAEQAAEKLYSHLDNGLLACVQLGFNGLFAGTAQLLFPTDSAAKLVAILTGEDLETSELDAIKMGTLTEVGNIVLNGVMGAIGNLLQQHLNYSIPVYSENTIQQLLHNLFGPEEIFVLGRARFEIEQLALSGEIILIFKVGSFENLVTALALES